MTAVRLSAIYLGLFAVFAAVLVFYVTATTADILHTQSRQAIADEIEDLASVYRSTGLVGLVRTIDLRSRQPGASLYLVTDATGRILAGNVQSLDAGVLDDAGFSEGAFGYERFADGSDGEGADAARGDRYHLAIAEVVALPNGMRVLVGRDQTEQERFRVIVRGALILALALMGVGALFAWFLVGRQALQRLNRMSASTARILGGDLDERLPVTGTEDEFDRLSANLNLLLGRIAQLQKGLRQVSDNIAHDLKTPLTRLRNRAETALADASEPQDARSALEGVIGEADQMIRTFDALLMISRVEAGSHPVEKAETDLAGIVADVAELYEPVAEAAGGTLSVRAEGPVIASVSRELIAQALANLVDNALKYGGTEERPPVVTVELAAEGDRCRLSVTDNGPGIPEDRRERVLERFYRLDESRNKPGSGLGLSLVKAIASIHGGTLRLDDAAPGLKVTIDLPLGTAVVPADG
ncbi:sensor histidine kinase [Mangrovicella endophytica]|uniref:sensor histidine kinase n=1 Tax=Mangrovicella endophytica TaxID=2066697 RepID=UPI001FE1DB59|nr:ATP-binding protein [Mangrovicella endophytica]